MARIHVVAQGTADWLALRAGIPTASNAGKILTPKRLEFSGQAIDYARFLAAEVILARSLEEMTYAQTQAMRRGQELEPQAAQMYEYETGTKVSPIGFMTTDDGRFGASPDLIVDDQPGAVELKCPLPPTHLDYLLDGFGDDYRGQAQFQCFVGELEWVDRYAYHPELPPVRIRTTRDDAYIRKLEEGLERLVEMRDEMVERAVAKGAIRQSRRNSITPAERMARRQGRYFTIIDWGDPANADRWPTSAG